MAGIALKDPKAARIDEDLKEKLEKGANCQSMPEKETEEIKEP